MTNIYQTEIQINLSVDLQIAICAQCAVIVTSNQYRKSNTNEHLHGKISLWRRNLAEKSVFWTLDEFSFVRSLCVIDDRCKYQNENIFLWKKIGNLN